MSLLPELSRHASVTLWTDQAVWDPIVEEYAEVRQYQPDTLKWEALNRADASIYNLGNHPVFHGAIWQVSRQHAGIVVLHERCLQHFFMGLYSQMNDPAGYASQMERYYGREGASAARACLDGRWTTDDLAERFPLTLLALENASGVFVHTVDLFERLKQEIELPIGYAPLPHSTGCDGNEPSSESKGPPYRLILFGHLGFNRRLDAVLEALGTLEGREMFRLDIYGTCDDRERVESQLRKHGLVAHVSVNGFVSKQELDRALSLAHLAINLRYPSMGESSLSQLRIWEHRLPSLVTRTGWYATLPEDAVAFVGVETEIADIHNHLWALASDPGRFAEMGETGYRFLREHHSPQRYVEALFKLTESSLESESVSVAFDLAQRAGRAMAGLWGDRIPEEVSRKAALEILALSPDLLTPDS
jgi:glycosyltransferase involved in cell wall biosynthesis